MKLKNLLKPSKYSGYSRFILKSIHKIHKDARSSYSQAGEDLLIQFAFRFLKISHPTYLDIGAHHPTRLSNTFYFYRNGSRGVCIEPNPTLASLFKKKRPRDTVLQIAIGTVKGETLLQIVSDTTLSTTSAIQAEYFSGTSKHSITQKIKVPAQTIMNVINEHFPITPPDFISLDIEGIDLEVLQSFNFNKCRPPVFCVETLTYTETEAVQKIPEIVKYMESHDYFVFADTYLNTIFIDKKRWNTR